MTTATPAAPDSSGLHLVCPGCGRLGLESLRASAASNEYHCVFCLVSWHIEPGCAWQLDRSRRRH